MTSAISSGDAHRLKSASGIARRLAGVSIVSGSTALTRTPAPFHSSAALRAKLMSAAFEAAYAAFPAAPS